MKVWAGTSVRTTGTFTGPTGDNQDPSTVTLEWRFQGGSVTTWTYGTGTHITKVSTGVYRATLTTASSTPSTWTVEWIGTGTCAAVGVASFTVQPKPL